MSLDPTDVGIGAQLTDDDWKVVGEFAASLPKMADIIQRVNRAHGWYDSARTPSDDAALLHTEVSEFFEEFREHGLQQFMRLRFTFKGKPEGGMVELMDVIIRALDTAARYDDPYRSLIKDCFNYKFIYNNSRPHRHGGKHA